MARDTPVRQQTAEAETDEFPNRITIVGRGVPSNFEITVDGELEMLVDDPVSEATIVSGGTAEGAIEVGVQRFRFSGELANISVVDWNGIPQAQSSSTPTVHVEYGTRER